MENKDIETKLIVCRAKAQEHARASEENRILALKYQGACEILEELLNTEKEEVKDATEPNKVE